MPRMINRRAQGSYSKKGRNNRAWDARNYIRSLDSFAKEVPAFNIQGQPQV